jgi:hypothetical protein
LCDGGSAGLVGHTAVLFVGHTAVLCDGGSAGLVGHTAVLFNGGSVSDTVYKSSNLAVSHAADTTSNLA